MSLRERIDLEIASAPLDPFDLHSTLQQGRRVVRRRRTWVVLSGAAATVALAVPVAAGLVMTGDPRPEAPVAGQESDVTCPAAGRSTPECSGQQFLNQDNVTLTPSGELVVRNGWTITQKIDDPIPKIEAVGVAVSDGTNAAWALIKYPDGDRDVSSEHVDPANLPAGVTFDAWLNFASSRWTGDATTVVAKFNDSGDLVAMPGWSILQQATNLTMPSRYRGPPGVTAVMQLQQDLVNVYKVECDECAEHAFGWYLVRRTPQGADAFPVLDPNGDMTNSVEGVLAYAATGYKLNEQGMVRPAQ